ncbi:uncharacterized protein LOC110461117 [Mizuhopecten yessoensis]|uniref:uncharacterized protein LOC110461117 n=1 Tax=Mizuhopecten yessoensis TaxID=6573 RepID=UPI000B45F306|nr:uncharacterized protein LOC110461117 [Mizuhopecten yessoensis]
MLLDKGADPNESEGLCQAACNGHTDIVKMLLDKGADPKESGALYQAAHQGNTDIVKMLLDKGADPKERIQMNFPSKGILDNPEVDSDKGLHSAMTSDISTAYKHDAKWFMNIVKERNMDDFYMLEKTFATTYQNDDSCASLLHSVAVYGTTTMVELMHNWNGIKWDEQYTVSGNRFGDTLDAITVEKATALYIATFLDRTEITESLVQCAGEDNISCCFQNIQLSRKMEQVFMLELAKRLKQKHCELQPAIVPGHKHENDDIRSRVFIVYSPDVVQASEYNFNGLALVKLSNPYVVQKAAIFEPNIEMNLCEKAIDKTKKAIKIHRQVLWKKHSNLNIITGSHIKYRRNGSDIEKRHCVVLYCSTKGVIPLGEERFPRRLHIDKDDYIDVDVREGLFEHSVYRSLPSTWPHPTLKMGCNIGRLTPQYNAQGNLLPNLGGTLGPCVRYNNNLGFLTCAHVLFDIPSPTYTLDFTASATHSVEVVQPSTDATQFQGGVACGVVERAIFDPTRKPSVDAAVVRLTDTARVPNAGQFSNELHSSYKNAGFNEMPEYNNGAMLTVAGVNGLGSTQNVVKFGSKTDVTRGALSVFGVNVRPLSTALGLPSGVGDVEMKDQYQVIGIHPSANFFEKGDSGSGVFCKDLHGVLHCIGMAIGSANVSNYQYRAGVVTPIEAVLQALGPNITLATFP